MTPEEVGAAIADLVAEAATLSPGVVVDDPDGLLGNRTLYLMLRERPLADFVSVRIVRRPE